MDSCQTKPEPSQISDVQEEHKVKLNKTLLIKFFSFFFFALQMDITNSKVEPQC